MTAFAHHVAGRPCDPQDCAANDENQTDDPRHGESRSPNGNGACPISRFPSRRGRRACANTNERRGGGWARYGFPIPTGGYRSVMDFILWLIAVILVVAGIVALVRGAVAYGLVLIVVGLLVGPGGVSLFT